MKKIMIGLTILSLLIWNTSSVLAANSTPADPISQLIELPASSYNKQEADSMISRIKQFQPNILARLVQNGVKIRLITGKLTDEPEYRQLKGVTPRGWEGTGKTWDDIPGVGGKPVILRIGYSDSGHEHGSLNLELHETSHAIDINVFNNISQGTGFTQLFKKEAKLLFPANAYMDSYSEEYFAESSCMFVYSLETRNKIKRVAPLTYAFFARLYGLPPSPPVHFTDLIDTYWAYDTIYKAVNEGYLSGYEDGSFKPDKEITRAEFLKMVTVALGFKPRQPMNNEFWYAPYLELGAKEFILRDQNIKNPKWNDPIKRKEMAEICVQALKLNEGMDAMQTAMNKGILQGTDKGFEPNRTSTRAQSVTIIERTLALQSAGTLTK
ncbi:S-layer homology domain-containing protein [Paenibacillus sp. GP183]|uniref:anthrax toxin lethal factor-related metalloendopeptidase n=1 Tax=Paenibacillus sp. GP183 TaxID=1882751 RepID=UPI00089D68BB|nr:S-layer homology domain-containing protein [Paenibacillus sp. GP183]SED15297.1 S-layer homology domain-containing protein [Paenibacillus sp. GP183]